MGRSTSTLSGSTTRGLTAISNLTIAKKARLFDHLQTAQANLAASNSSTTVEDSEEPVVYLANAYSATARFKPRNHDMISNTGAYHFIFHSIDLFINLCPTPPISLKTADGSCNLIARHTGDVVV